MPLGSGWITYSSSRPCWRRQRGSTALGSDISTSYSKKKPQKPPALGGWRARREVCTALPSPRARSPVPAFPAQTCDMKHTPLASKCLLNRSFPLSHPIASLVLSGCIWLWRFGSPGGTHPRPTRPGARRTWKHRNFSLFFFF